MTHVQIKFILGVTTNWRSSFTVALGMMLIDYFTYNTRLYKGEREREREREREQYTHKEKR
jgi:hypothetical protein